MNRNYTRSLLVTATALGMTVGVLTIQSAHAVEGIKGEAEDVSHETWIDIVSYSGGELTEGVQARVEDNVLMLKDSEGKFTPAQTGEYKLKDGRVISVKDGNVENIKQPPQFKMRPKLKERP